MKTLPLREQILYLTQLSFFIRSGMTLSDSISILSTEALTTERKNFWDNIQADTDNGIPFSTSITRHTFQFEYEVPRVITLGEHSGRLGDVLDTLARELHKKQALRVAVRSALLYPLLITCAAIGIVLTLIVFVFPKITPVFISMDIALPLPTRTILTISNILREYWLGIILIIGISVYMGTTLYKTNPRIRCMLDYVLIKTPLVGIMIQEHILTTLFRTLHILLTSGSTLTDALSITRSVTYHTLYKKALVDIESACINGSSCADAFRTQKLFPHTVIALLRTGEETGSMSEATRHLATLFDERLTEKTKNLTTTIEPVLMITLGVVVGFIAISIIMPLYAITNHIQQR